MNTSTHVNYQMQKKEKKINCDAPEAKAPWSAFSLSSNIAWAVLAPGAITILLKDGLLANATMCLLRCCCCDLRRRVRTLWRPEGDWPLTPAVITDRFLSAPRQWLPINHMTAEYILQYMSQKYNLYQSLWIWLSNAIKSDLEQKINCHCHFSNDLKT